MHNTDKTSGRESKIYLCAFACANTVFMITLSSTYVLLSTVISQKCKISSDPSYRNWVGEKISLRGTNYLNVNLSVLRGTNLSIAIVTEKPKKKYKINWSRNGVFGIPFLSKSWGRKSWDRIDQQIPGEQKIEKVLIQKR